MVKRSRSKTRVLADKIRYLYLIRQRFNCRRFPAEKFSKKKKTLPFSFNFPQEELDLVGETTCTPSPSSFYFPPELLEEEILSRIVCKSWRNLISTQGSFTFLLQLHHNCNDSTIWKTSISTASKATCSARYKVEADIPSVVQYPKCSPTPRYYPNLTGPCNGIFCLHSMLADNIALWNPAQSINQNFKIIPKPNSPRLGPATFCTVGFGFDPETNDYMILQVVLDTFDKYHQRYQFELYSLKTNSWRKLDIDTPSNSFEIKSYNTQFTAANGKLMGWLVHDSASMTLVSRRYQILIFDVSNETFDMIPVSQDELFNQTAAHCVFPFRESIAVVVTNTGVAGTCFEIWALNDISSTHQPRFWSKLWTVEHNNLVHKPQGFWGNWGLIFLHRESGNLTLYDFLNKDLMDFGVGVPGPKAIKAFAYKECLVSPFT